MKIGEFAKLSSATIRTLRYYDDLGLLKPDRVDQFTGYRIYSSKKLEQMREIQAMKEIGFTLLEIKSFLEIDDSDETAKIDFISAKREEIEIERKKAETNLTALDDLIVRIKEGGEKMENKNYCLPFCGMTDDEGLSEARRIHNEENGMAYSELKSAPKFIKVCAYHTGFGAISEDGTPYVWGDERNIPDGLSKAADFDIGYVHSCAIDINGKLHGWGANIIPAIDFPDDLYKIKMVSVKAHADKTVALSEDGKVFCFGEHNKSAQKDVPRNMGFVKQISVGAYHTAALNSDGKVFSWGVFPTYQPKLDTEIISIAASDYNISYLGADGNVYGNLKPIEVNKKFKPKPEMTNIKKIFAGRETFAAIDGDGKLYVWGECNTLPGSNSVLNIPLNLPKVTDAAFGANEIICLGEDGKLYGWGILDIVVPPVFDGFNGEPVFEENDKIIDVNVPVDVYTFDELCDAVREKIRDITIKGDMTISGDSFYVINEITLTIAEGVTVSVSCLNFFIQKKLINNGTIKGGGRIILNNPIEGNGNVITGDKVNTFGISKGLGLRLVGVDACDIRKYLSEDSIYTDIGNIYNAENNFIIIDSDLVIPKGKTLSLNDDYTLKVNKDVTLTIEGSLRSTKDPIVHGTIIGEIWNYNSKSNREACSFEDLCEVVPQNRMTEFVSSGKITIKNDITVTGDKFHIIHDTTVVIEEGVTLTVDTPDFTVYGEIVNNGTITGSGKIYSDRPVTGAGKIDTGNGVQFALYDPEISELNKYLSKDSIYSEIIFTGLDSGQDKSVFYSKFRESVITFDKDLVVPRGKSLWLHANCILNVSDGVTLKIDGKIETFNEPVVEGTVIGNITIIDVNNPRDVYTYSEFCDAARNMANEITIKGDITLPAILFGPFIGVNTLIIDKGATLTGDSCGLLINTKLINNGRICGTGRIHIQGGIEGSGTTDTSDGLAINARVDSGDEIGEYLTEDAVYTEVNIMKRENDKDNIITINKDLVIPKGKSLWLNVYCTLKVNEGVTLKIDGRLETYNEPMIDGTVIGDISVLDKFPF